MVEIIDAEIVINELQHKGIIHLTEENIDRKGDDRRTSVYFIWRVYKKYVLKIDKPENISYTEKFLHTYEEIYLLLKLYLQIQTKIYFIYIY